MANGLAPPGGRSSSGIEEALGVYQPPHSVTTTGTPVFAATDAHCASHRAGRRTAHRRASRRPAGLARAAAAGRWAKERPRGCPPRSDSRPSGLASRSLSHRGSNAVKHTVVVDFEREAARCVAGRARWLARQARLAHAAHEHQPAWAHSQHRVAEHDRATHP
eukprot:2723699-Prymnesium_polylepis.1